MTYIQCQSNSNTDVAQHNANYDHDVIDHLRVQHQGAMLAHIVPDIAVQWLERRPGQHQRQPPAWRVQVGQEDVHPGASGLHPARLSEHQTREPVQRHQRNHAGVGVPEGHAHGPSGFHHEMRCAELRN